MYHVMAHDENSYAGENTITSDNGIHISVNDSRHLSEMALGKGHGFLEWLIKDSPTRHCGYPRWKDS